jgi:hypothetical protein
VGPSPALSDEYGGPMRRGVQPRWSDESSERYAVKKKLVRVAKGWRLIVTKKQSGARAEVTCWGTEAPLKHERRSPSLGET